MEEYSGLLFTLLIPIGLIVLFVLALVWQKQGLSTQKDAMSHVEESLDLAHRTLELQRRAVALAEESIHYQREILEALRTLGGRDSTQSSIRNA